MNEQMKLDRLNNCMINFFKRRYPNWELLLEGEYNCQLFHLYEEEDSNVLVIGKYVEEFDADDTKDEEVFPIMNIIASEFDGFTKSEFRIWKFDFRQTSHNEGIARLHQDVRID